ncbi:myb-binding protein 1A [Rhagoletis pomonella]|uniref:myb-binding protein 1A n=1 Tax=Rhagoletis pomonella TaxID=28610 RepID=UPI00177FE2C0|nr:myb-binding protein 1A [Rhagoletis pomonella]
MKIKSAKKAAKRDLPAKDDGESDISSAPPAKSPKKAKFLNGINGEVEEQAVEKPPAEKSGGSVNVSIFQHFKELTNDDEDKRMKAALQLLQQLSKTKEADKRQKELTYALKRLVRGCGAATNTSRAGFYTGLVAFLKAFDEQEITLEHIFDTMQKELHVGATVGNKDDADAVVGKILVCGALQQAGRLDNIEHNEYLERITNTLIQATKQRSYHASLGYALLVELVEKLSPKQFSTVVWPSLQNELQRSWSKQTLQTVHCLIATQLRFPKIANAKFMKAHFGHADLLQPESYAHLYRLFWEHNNMQLLTHPAFEAFGSYIAKSDNLNKFWLEQVDAGLESSNKLRELITLKIATDVFNNWQQSQETEKKHVAVADLLSPNFMHLLVEGLKNQKQKKDETLKAFYDDFFEALVSCCTKLADDKQLVAVIRRLILPPGQFGIEKYTSTRVVHQLINALGTTGVKKVYTLHHNIFLGLQPKNPSNASEEWLNFERMNAGYVLQHLLAHKSMRQEYDWREQQLRFLLTCGIFYVNESADICKKESASTFSNDFGEQCKNMFFTSMQSRLVDLQQEKQLLLKLVQHCNERMGHKHALKYFRIKQYDDTLHKYWQQMHTALGGSETSGKKKDKSKSTKATVSDDKLELVFQILLLNMGLQLFREPEMAGPAIEDLLKCMQRVKEKHKKKQKTKESVKNSETEDEEPEWIEVVVDLFLHLLSQNATALRNIVNALFPHLCGSLNLTAVHQILAVLDMKDGHNPLSAHGDESEDEDEEDTDDDDDETQGGKNKKSPPKLVNGKADNDAEGSGDDNDDEDEDGNDDDDDDDEEDEDDDDDDDDAEEDEATAADRLRNAVSQALMAHGGMPTAGDDDDDMASIDLNDMTEEEGHKLDEALAEAFKAMRKTGGGGAAAKKSKSYRVKITTVMHFRIRVLDLLEIYLQQQPLLLIAIEVMLALYNMLPHCVGDELKPLQIKVEKVLQKLTALKYDVADVQEDEVVAFIRLIVEQKSPAAAFEAMNKLRNKCIIFLVNSAIKIAAEKSDDCKKVLALYEEYLQEFLQSRNPSVNITLLSDIFRLRWSGVWQLAVSLSRKGLNLETRAFRRIQIYELLDVLYKNHELQRLDVSTAKTQLKQIESALCSHIKALAAGTGTEISPKEYTVLLQLLMQAQKTHHRLQVKSALADVDIKQAIQSMRADSTQVYQRYCAAYKLLVERGNGKGKQKMNGKQAVGEAAATAKREHGDHVGNDTLEAVENDGGNGAQKKRKKINDKALRKLKKQKKEQRLQVASAGLNGSFAFVRQASNEDDEEAEEE